MMLYRIRLSVHGLTLQRRQYQLQMYGLDGRTNRRTIGGTTGRTRQRKSGRKNERKIGKISEGKYGRKTDKKRTDKSERTTGRTNKNKDLRTIIIEVISCSVSWSEVP